MPAKPKKLKKLLREKLPEEKLEEKPVVTEGEIDTDVLASVIKKMEEKYEKAGIERGTSEIKEMRKNIEYGAAALRIKKGTPKDLLFFESSYIRSFAKFYGILEAPLSFLSGIIDRFFGIKLRGDLVASGMMYSPQQYLSLIASTTAVIWILSLFIIFSFVVLFNLNIGIAIFTLAIVPFLSIAFAVLIPSVKAQRKAVEIDRQLPFALRHMSIEIKAGVSIYKVMESIAGADYGALSNGFKYVLFSIEKGVSTEDALESWALSTRSDGLKRAMFHLVRALRTGGNLSEIMITIADDVSFEHRLKINEYAGKLSLMSLFLLMTAIVFPIMLTILTAVGTSPQIKAYVPLFSIFSPSFLVVLYFALCPALIILFVMIVKSSDPGCY